MDAAEIAADMAPATDGAIAVINLQSARRNSWARFWHAPERPDVAELIVEQEQLTAQFIGDLAAFDRLEDLADEFARAQPQSGRAELVAAQVACTTHRFEKARFNLTLAVARSAPTRDTERLLLAIDQATGANLPAVLAARRERVAQAGCWDELVPLASLLADLNEFDEAERTYRQALREYPDLSPFALAWVCFQLGVLCGELVPIPQLEQAAQWYRTAIDYVPGYVKARVHLAEIFLDQGRIGDARALLIPVLESGDPEVRWRLADVARAAGDDDEAELQLQAARVGFETLLVKHPLAFADHAAEFYAGSGADPQRALQLARQNLANRSTPRALEQVRAIEMQASASRQREQAHVRT